MEKATDWIKSHKPHTAAIAIAIIAVVAVVIAAASGALSTADKQDSTAKAETADLVLNVTADTGWDANSTPAIAHITSDEVDFYHAVSPDAEGNKGTSTVTLEEGDYTVDFISPVNADGSAYELFDTGEAQTVTVDADATDTLSVTCEMTRIPADKVTDEMLKGIVDQTKDAVENGDETLKGDAGKDILDKLEGNVAENPNASDETKQEATDADKEVDVDGQPEATTPSGDNGNTSDTGNANSNGNNGSGAGNSDSNGNGSSASGGSSSGSSNKPSAPAHSHSWKDHTATKQVWVPNIVTVPDYETQQVFSHYLYVFSADGYSTTDINAVKAHSVELAKQGLSTNYSNVPQYTEQTVQVGSHTEDHGHYETQTYVDYQYCDCGATR